jgi:hypothetical protein
MDDTGARVDEAGPSTAVQVCLGLDCDHSFVICVKQFGSNCESSRKYCHGLQLKEVFLHSLECGFLCPVDTWFEHGSCGW